MLYDCWRNHKASTSDVAPNIMYVYIMPHPVTKIKEKLFLVKEEFYYDFKSY